MKNFARILLLGTVAVSLAACGGLELGKAKGVAAKGSPFDQALYSEYVGLSQMEYDEADYADSDAFALRGMAAAAGGSPQPEAIAARGLPADKVRELTAARNRLVAALGNGAAQKVAKPAARAQAMYECWMQEQEENFQPKDIAACRAWFEEAMAQVDAALRPAPMAAAPAAAPAPAPKPMPMPGPFMLYFDFDSAKLAPAAQKLVADAAAEIAKTKATTVVVTGHADRSGTDKYNLALSKKRADAVAAALKGAGVTATIKMVIASLG